MSDVESFNIKFSYLRNYSIKIFCHLEIYYINPLAGQGFNMTIRVDRILI